MRVFQILTTLLGITLSGLGGVMMFTNPGQGAYEQYATEELAVYLKDSVCSQVSSTDLEGVLRNGCKILVDTGRPQITHLISQTTQRQNYVLFSVYRTELNFESTLPSYQFETIGVLQNFYTYGAGEF